MNKLRKVTGAHPAELRLYSPSCASGERRPFRYTSFRSSGLLTVDKLRKAASANPKALHFVPDRHEVMGVFTCAAAEAADGDVSLLWLGFGFFPVKFNGVPFFDSDCAFGADSYAKAHAVAEFFGYDFCFPVDDPDCAFGTGGNAFPAAGTFFFVNFYNHPFYHNF